MIMKKISKYFYLVLFFAFIPILQSCEEYLEPYEETGKYDDQIVWGNPAFAEGVLLRAYGLLPTDYLRPEDFGADDAVVNQLDHSMISVATGGWSARNNPLDSYNSTYNAMLQINLFLENVDSVIWSPSSSVKDSLLKKRLKGEAYGLRAYFGSLLLRNVGGKSSSGELLGYPVVTSSHLDDAKLPRDLYRDCVNQIFQDCDSAIKLLPLRWSNTGMTTDERDAFGERYQNRINGITAMLIKARVALTAASDAFKESGITMMEAAEYAADIIQLNGFDKFSPIDLQFYLQARNTNDLSYFYDNSEVFWYSSIQANSSDREANYYPPSLYGKGLISPSQNFVGCFGDYNGIPLEESTVYTTQKPYNMRDPRLYMYVFFNGASTEKGDVIDIKNGEKDGIGKTVNSTRTGYYMRKLLDENVILTPGLLIRTPHFYVYARYTEALLNFAEAANEAVGPDGNIKGFTARDILKRIRNRAGIFNDTYLNSLDKNGMRTLIRNERRIELSFEGFRFWDLRRWNDLGTLNQSVMGINLIDFSEFEVEKRQYESYMVYGPIPHSETLKYDIQQNAGWN
jgi:starch-binding outer membrane protein, SusD/RagB family